MSAVEIKAADLSSTQKAVIEELLGREVDSAETIGLRVFPTELAREQARKALIEWLERAEPGPAIDEAELDAAVVEAMRTVRPGYREIR